MVVSAYTFLKDAKAAATATEESGSRLALSFLPHDQTDFQPARIRLLRDRLNDDNRYPGTDSGLILRWTRRALPSRAALFLALLLSAAAVARAGQAAPSQPAPQLPEAPQPQVAADTSRKATQPCKVSPAPKPHGTAAAGTAPNSAANTPAGATTPDTQVQLPPCPHAPVNWFARFLTGPAVKPLTAKEKARLAVRNLLDPFNAITILGQSAISVASDSHSPYGPGVPGFGRNVGVSYTQDMTGEFVGTFLIPSIFHQDPHYHRMPNRSIPRRAGHAMIQVLWTQGDNGKGMLNYANLVGFAIDDEISNLYVPGEQTNLPSSAARYSIGLATAPIDNFVTEFLPDVARRIHVRIVLVQRIINQVAKTDGPSGP